MHGRIPRPELDLKGDDRRYGRANPLNPRKQNEYQDGS
jgi:hypothetical protein